MLTRGQGNCKDVLTVLLYISLGLVWHNLKCIMFAYGLYSGVIEDSDRLEYGNLEEDTYTLKAEAASSAKSL
jgi:hypothetical protein